MEVEKLYGVRYQHPAPDDGNGIVEGDLEGEDVIHRVQISLCQRYRGTSETASGQRSAATLIRFHQNQWADSV
jgi:hypothetical protein